MDFVVIQVKFFFSEFVLKLLTNDWQAEFFSPVFFIVKKLDFWYYIDLEILMWRENNPFI